MSVAIQHQKKSRQSLFYKLLYRPRVKSFLWRSGLFKPLKYLRNRLYRNRSFVEQSELQVPMVLLPQAPSPCEWDALKRTFSPNDAAPAVDVLVPVYGGYHETMRCLFSVLSARQKTPYRLLVVNDASPDTQLVAELTTLHQAGLFDLINLPQNLGFVGACNVGMNNAPDRDVLLLNADTEVHHDWLDRMREAAYSELHVATVTPCSNNAEICSYPKFVQNNQILLEVTDGELDQLASVTHANKTLPIPTGVGFCMYIRRACLNEIGLFDIKHFGKGYGEENDLCRRAAKAGWVNLLAPNVFVRHYGGVSFGTSKLKRIAKAIQTIERMHPGYSRLIHEFIALDPVKPFREALDVARMKYRAPNGSILLVLHNLGGGVNVHVDDMSVRIRQAGIGAFICKVNLNHPNMLKITNPVSVSLSNMPEFDMMTANIDKFAMHLRTLDVRHIHIHHLADFPEETSDFLRIAASRAGIRYDVTLHDYISICPRITLIGRSGVYCGEPVIAECEKCIQQEGSAFGKPAVSTWRERYARLLTHARCVFVPNEDVSIRLKRYFPNINFLLRPHPERSKPAVVLEKPVIISRQKDVRVIAMIGAIGLHKGSALLEQVAKAAKRLKLPLRFHVVGYTDRDASLSAIGNVKIAGKYANEDAARLLLEVNADFVFFASVLPETYSYTLSTTLAARQFPVAFDIGAIARRIKDANFGKLLPVALMSKPRELAVELARLEVPRNMVLPQWKLAEYPHVLNDYYDYGFILPLPSPISNTST